MICKDIGKRFLWEHDVLYLFRENHTSQSESIQTGTQRKTYLWPHYSSHFLPLKSECKFIDIFLWVEPWGCHGKWKPVLAYGVPSLVERHKYLLMFESFVILCSEVPSHILVHKALPMKLQSHTTVLTGHVSNPNMLCPLPFLHLPSEILWPLHISGFR